MIKYIDIHSHLGFEDYGADQKEVIKRMQENGVATIAIGADLASSKEAVKVATENENIWACIGQHPTDNMTEAQVTHGSLGSTPHSFSEVGFDENEYEKLVVNPKVVAIGECGLDYYTDSADKNADEREYKEKQKIEFKKQIEFAIKYDKPLMLHIRDGKVKGEAFNDAYDILHSIFPGRTGDIRSTQLRGNVHFFTGKIDQAKRFIEMGFTISFTGLITYVRDFDKVIKNIPLEFIHAETDAPYVAPVPYRGQRNESSYVVEVVKKIAEIRGEDFETVRLQLLKNAEKFFDISL